MASNPRVRSYMLNLGKSMLFSSAQVVGQAMPAMSSTITNNKEMVSSGINYTRGFINKRGPMSSKSSDMLNKFFTDIEDVKKNAFEDLKTGKFVNFERQAQAFNESMGLDDFGADWGEPDEDPFGGGMMDDDVDLDAGSSTSRAIRTSAKVNELGSNMRTKAVMDTINSSTEASTTYLAKTQKKLQAITMNMQAQMHTEMIKSVGDTNSLLTTVVEFQNNQLVDHMNKQLVFYDNVLGELREIKAALKPEPEQANEKKNPISEVFGFDGGFNLKAYGEQVKKNIQDMMSTSGIGLLSTAASMGGGPMAQLKASPLSFVTDMMLAGIMPKTMKDAMGKLDTSLSGFISSLVLRLDGMKGDLSKPASSLLASILGIDVNPRSEIDVSNFHKGQVPFTGKTDKAITEVIPTLLSHIHSAIVGSDKVAVYNYSTGKFTNLSDARRSDRDRIRKDQRNEMSDLRDEMRKQLSSMSGGNSNRVQQDLDNFIDFLVSYRGFYNPLKDKDVDKLMRNGLKLSDPSVYSMLRESILKMPKSMQSSISRQVLTARAEGDRTARKIEEELFESGLSAAYSDLDKVLAPKANTDVGKNPIYSVLKDIKDILIDGIIVYEAGDSSPQGLKSLLRRRSSNTKTNFAVETTQASPKVESVIYEKEDEDDLMKMQIDAVKGKFSKSLLGEKSLVKRLKMIRDKVSPTQFIMGALERMDNLVYRIIYGKEDKGGDDDGEPGADDKRNGFGLIGRFSSGFRRAMDNSIIWMDKKIFSPMYEKFFGEEGLFTKFMEQFEPFLNRMKEIAGTGYRKVVRWLMGEKTAEGFYTGGALSDIGNMFVDFGNSMRSTLTGGAYKKADGTVVPENKESVFAYIKNYSKALFENIKVGMFGEKKEIVKEDGTVVLERNKDGVLHEIFDNLKEMGRSYLSVFKTHDDETPDDVKRTIGQWKTELKGFLPKGIAGGLMGMAASFLLPGGPLLGAFIGTSLAFASHSNKFRELLFGNEEKDGVVPKKILDGVKKFFPAVAAGATLGLGAGAILPGVGMLGMMTLGAGLAFASKSEKAQQFIFGKTDKDGNPLMDGILPKDAKEKFRRYLPKVGAGALLGGGLGLLTGSPILGMMIGASLSFVRQSERMQKNLFGETDEEGNVTKRGKIPPKVVSLMKRVAPGLKVGGPVGLLASLLLPGGPMFWIPMATALAMSTKANTVQEMLFGKRKSGSNEEETPQELAGQARSKFGAKMPKALSGAFFGAVAGGLGILGPAGPFMGAIIGSILSLNNVGKKVKDMFFGNKDKSADQMSDEEVADTAVKKYKFAIPRAVAGSIVGAIAGGVGLIDPAGPLMGAAIAGVVAMSGIGFHVNRMLFGRKGKNGKQSEGFTDILKRRLGGDKEVRRHLITSALGAVAGGIGLLGPAGPIAGAVIGATVSISGIGDKVMDFVFGTERSKNRPSKKGFLGQLREEMFEEVVDPETGEVSRKRKRVGFWGALSISQLVAKHLAGYLSKQVMNIGIKAPAIVTKAIVQATGQVTSAIFKRTLYEAKSLFGKLRDNMRDFIDYTIKYPMMFISQRVKKWLEGPLKSIGGWFSKAFKKVVDGPIGTFFKRMFGGDGSDKGHWAVRLANVLGGGIKGIADKLSDWILGPLAKKDNPQEKTQDLIEESKDVQEQTLDSVNKLNNQVEDKVGTRIERTNSLLERIISLLGGSSSDIGSMMSDIVEPSDDIATPGQPLPPKKKSLFSRFMGLFKKKDKSKNNIDIDGSHATGLDAVPYDNYTARLHRGEMILPASQANRIRRAMGVGTVSASAAGGEMTGRNALVNNLHKAGGGVKSMFNKFRGFGRGLARFAGNFRKKFMQRTTFISRFLRRINSEHHYQQANLGLLQEIAVSNFQILDAIGAGQKRSLLDRLLELIQGLGALKGLLDGLGFDLSDFFRRQFPSITRCLCPPLSTNGGGRQQRGARTRSGGNTRGGSRPVIIPGDMSSDKEKKNKEKKTSTKTTTKGPRRWTAIPAAIAGLFGGKKGSSTSKGKTGGNVVDLDSRRKGSTSSGRTSSTGGGNVIDFNSRRGTSTPSANAGFVSGSSSLPRYGMGGMKIPQLPAWMTSVSKRLPVLGTAVSIGMGAKSIADAEDKGRTAASVVGETGGAMAGIAAGAALGAAMGAPTGPGALITGTLGAILGGIAGKEGMERLYDNVLSKIDFGNVWNEFTNAAKNSWDNTTQTIRTGWNNTRDAVSNAWNATTSTVKTGWRNVQNTWHNARRNVMGWFGKGPSSSGGKIPNGFSVVSNVSHLSQADPSIRRKRFGKTMDTIGDSGCAPAVAAMALTAITGKEVEVTELAKIANDKGFKVGFNGTNPSFFKYLEKDYPVVVKNIMGRNMPKSIISALKDGKFVILMGGGPSNSIVSSKGDSYRKYTPFGDVPHYVLVTGYNPRNNDLLINDPLVEDGYEPFKFEHILETTTGAFTIEARSTKSSTFRVSDMKKFMPDVPMPIGFGRGTYTDEQLASEFSYAMSTPKSDVTLLDLRTVKSYADQYGVNPHLWWSLVELESSFDSKAVNSASDARGWGQIIPSTGKWLYEDKLKLGKYDHSKMGNNKSINSRLSMYYLSMLLQEEGGDIRKALKRYNGGEIGDRYPNIISNHLKENAGLTFDQVLNPGALSLTPGSTGINQTAGSGLSQFMGAVSDMYKSILSDVYGGIDLTSLSSIFGELFNSVDPFSDPNFFFGYNPGLSTGSANVSESLQRTLEALDSMTLKQKGDMYGSQIRNMYQPVLSGDTDIHQFFAERLYRLAKTKNATISINSGLRTVAEQQALIDERKRKFPNESDAERRRWVADPGNSSHGYGMAADISGWIQNLSPQELEAFGLWRPFSWEPWHFEPIETKSMQRTDDYMLKHFGYPFSPNHNFSTSTPINFNSFSPSGSNMSQSGLYQMGDADPSILVPGAPDASGYRLRAENAASALKSDSSDPQVIHLLKLIASGINKLVDLTDETAELLVNYLENINKGSQPTVAIVNPGGSNRSANPFTGGGQNSSPNQRVSKTGAIKAIASGVRS